MNLPAHPPNKNFIITEEPGRVRGRHPVVPSVVDLWPPVQPRWGPASDLGRGSWTRLPASQAVGAALSPEEQRVLQRKQKKARKQQLRAAGRTGQAAGARPSGAQLALDYLCGWAQKHASWRFQKTRQTWLLLHMFEEDKVPDEHFPTLLAYLEGLRGRARELTLQKAEALMRELDATGSQDSPLDAATQGKTQRLRQVLQLLS